MSTEYPPGSERARQSWYYWAKNTVPRYIVAYIVNSQEDGPLQTVWLRDFFQVAAKVEEDRDFSKRALEPVYDFIQYMMNEEREFRSAEYAVEHEQLLELKDKYEDLA